MRFLPVSDLQPISLDADHVQLAALEEQLREREGELIQRQMELRLLQQHYLEQIGPLYEELAELETAVIEAEVRLGLREPTDSEPSREGEGDEAPDMAHGETWANAAPSADLRRIFRDVAKAIHPDLAMDEPARNRRHSLMAEANRAYAERDEDRLRLILRAWERSPDSAFSSDPEVEQDRVKRRIAYIHERLILIAAEFDSLRRSAISRLKDRIDEARAQGWDLFAEMITTVRRDIARATMRLASVRRMTGIQQR